MASPPPSAALLVGRWRAELVEPVRKLLLEEVRKHGAKPEVLDVDAFELESTLFLRIFSLEDAHWESTNVSLLERIAARLIREFDLPVWLVEEVNSRLAFGQLDGEGRSAAVTKAALMKKLGWKPTSLVRDFDRSGIALDRGERVALSLDAPRASGDRANNLRKAMERRPIAPMVVDWLVAARKAQTGGQEARLALGEKTKALAHWCDLLSLELQAAATAARINTHHRFGSRLDVLMEWLDEPTDVTEALKLLEEDGRGPRIQQGLESLQPPGANSSRDEREDYELELQRLANLVFGCGAFVKGVFALGESGR